ncbi:MAG TPA: metal-sensitive transcriptional regulator [Thermoanaerobaculia bacterium]|nr:metal-sensitive transcriptional regulator [Thermoanaerobaculia bacterium]
MGIGNAGATPPHDPSEQASSEHDASEHALHREPESKRRLLARLRRIEGQVRGLHRMVEEERYCPEILTQVAAVQASLRSTAEVLLHDHLRHCVTGALRSGDPREAEATYRELTDLFKKYGR